MAGCQETWNGTTSLQSEWVGLVAKTIGMRRARYYRPTVRVGGAGCQENCNEEGDGTTGLLSEWVGLVVKRTGMRRVMVLQAYCQSGWGWLPRESERGG